MRHAQDQRRAEQGVVDMLRRDTRDLRAELQAKLHELAVAELRHAEAVVAEARVFAETMTTTEGERGA
jgi:hypothetical protein